MRLAFTKGMRELLKQFYILFISLCVLTLARKAVIAVHHYCMCDPLHWRIFHETKVEFVMACITDLRAHLGQSTALDEYEWGKLMSVFLCLEWCTSISLFFQYTNNLLYGLCTMI